MAPSVDEAYVHEHCKVLSGLPVVLDTPGLVEEIEQADHLFARFANIKNPRLTLHSAAKAGAAGRSVHTRAATH